MSSLANPGFAALQRLRTAIGDAEALARLIERGQASNPLADHFATLGREIGTTTFQGHLVPITEEDLEKLQQVPELARTFEQLPPVNQVLRFGDDTSDFAKLSHFVAIAGATDRQLTDSQVSYLVDLADSTSFVAAILFVDKQDDELPKENWPSQILPSASPILKLSIPVDEATPWLQRLGREGPIASGCIGLQMTRRLDMALQMLEDRLEMDRRALEGRRRTLTYRFEQTDGKARERLLREAGDSVRTGLDEQLGRVATELAERQRLRCAPGSPKLNALDNLIEDISTENLTFERTTQRERVRLDSDFLKQCEQKLFGLVTHDVKTDAKDVNNQIELAINQVQDRFKLSNVTASTLGSEKILEVEHLQSLQKLLVLDLRTQGELPKRTFVDRLNYGRRPVFLVMTLASLVGAAFGARGGVMILLAPIMLIVFVIGIVWTFRSFQTERQEQLDRVLHQMREAVRSEIRRLYESATREWQSRLQAYLTKTQRDILRQVNATLQDSMFSQSKQIEAERLDVRDKLRTLDGRLRELATAFDTTTKLRRIGQECRAAFEKTVNELLAGAP